MPCVSRSSVPCLAAIILTCVTVGEPVRAADVDTEHLFGFSEGADIGRTGDHELESETIARAGKIAGRYGVVTQNLEAKVVPVENFRIGGTASLAYFGIFGVPGLENRGDGALQGLSFDLRYTAINRAHAPFGLTLIAEPRWGRVDDISGDAVRSYGGTFTLALDKALIPGTLFGMLNLIYDADASHLHTLDIWQHQSKAGIAAALSTRVQGELFLGGELRYLRAFDGLGFNTYAGQALFAGPTMYLRLSKQWAMSAAWNWQVRGHTAAGGGALDLVHFERQQAKIRVNFTY